MRTFMAALALSVVLASCASRPTGSFESISSNPRPAVSLSKQQVTMTPDNVLSGKVARVNQEGRFVVMSFPIGHLPMLNQRLSVYRKGMKVGEIRVTGPQLDDSVVGDISAGEVQAADEVRDQ